jgi:hypothetical protein
VNNSSLNSGEIEEMGRISKTKIDEIKRLSSEGYLKSEIAKKVGVSRGTVIKYAPKEGLAAGDKGFSLVLEALVLSFYQLLTNLNCSPYLDEASMVQMTENLALKFTEKITFTIPI